MTKAQTHQIHISTQDNWETPPDILEKIMTKYDIHPTLDVCATIQNTKFPKYYTIHEDALTVQWTEGFL